jgi:hypothetical protein
LVSRERRRLAEMAATSSTAWRKAASFVFDGLLKPLIFRTYWSEADRISSGVTGGSKLKSILMFRHMSGDLVVLERARGGRVQRNTLLGKIKSPTQGRKKA